MSLVNKFQNTSKFVSKDASEAGEYCSVVFVSIFFKLFDIWPKK